MSLRKSPVRTPALLAACRSNAQKSTGPRTPEGKARVRLNGLQHGRYCRKLHRLLPEGLSFSDRLRYNWIRRAIENCFRPATARERERALRLAIEVWCQAAGALGKKDCLTGNVTENRQVGSKRRLPQIAYQIATRNPRQSLTFWTQGWGRRARLRVGEARRPRARALMAGWHGYRRVADWSEEPLPDPERDPMGFWHWRRACERQLRAFRRARAREARRQQARQAFAARVAARYQTASLRPSLPAAAAASPSPPQQQPAGRDRMALQGRNFFSFGTLFGTCHSRESGNPRNTLRADPGEVDLTASRPKHRIESIQGETLDA